MGWHLKGLVHQLDTLQLPLEIHPPMTQPLDNLGKGKKEVLHLQYKLVPASSLNNGRCQILKSSYHSREPPLTTLRCDVMMHTLCYTCIMAAS